TPLTSPSLLRPPPTSTLFPYTTLFRSRAGALCLIGHRSGPLRDARRPRLHAARQDPQIRGRLSRHERLLADVAGAEALRQFPVRSEEHTSELQSLAYLVCRLLLEKKKK